VKCEQYWFDDYETHLYGNILVMLVKVMSYANFTIRIFRLSKDEFSSNDRLVYQYQFLAWPEHGVPSDPLTLLEFRMKIRSRTSNIVSSDDSPLLVHCGTGVSRSGVFIAIDYSLMRAKEENCVNVYRYEHNQCICGL
jgi:protein tyrosine phosphatase